MDQENNTNDTRNKLKAAEIIRQKVSKIYRTSPSISEEEKISELLPNDSPHQQFIKNLTNSNRSIVEIQTAWHDYYLSLPDKEKFQVWQEFYDSNIIRLEKINTKANEPSTLTDHKTQLITQKKNRHLKFNRVNSNTNLLTIKNQLINQVSKSATPTKLKRHLQSLIFGLLVGFLAIFIFLFGFFNQIIITPFIQPSSTVAATPLILTGNNVAPTPNPEVIIPKINVQIPVIYSQTSTSETAIENNLESGVVHYPTTVLPGQFGNSAFFGHSSNNILNPGKYKFAFVLLHTLVNGDTFYLTYKDKIYVYKVISHQIVSPNDVSVLNTVPGQLATATLITCDPPGTSINRLVVVGQQISPNPNSNTTAPISSINYQTPSTLPGNGPSLFSETFKSITNKIIGIVILVIILIIVVRWLYKFKNEY